MDERPENIVIFDGKANTRTSILVDFLFTTLVRSLVAAYHVFSFVRFYWRQVVYAWQRYFVYGCLTPQQIREDVSSLPKIPQHVAFVLELTTAGGVEKLVQQAIECSGWCLGAGNSQVTIYERTGALQEISPQSIANAVRIGLSRYFEYGSVPAIAVRCGREIVTAGSVTNSESASGEEASGAAGSATPALEITLASEKDGRPLLVDMAQTYAEEIHNGKLHQHEITVDKVHKDLQERVGEEPDLLVTFGSKLDMEGFSPWLIRVTELFHLPDNNNVFHYMVFAAALHNFSHVKVNLGS